MTNVPGVFVQVIGKPLPSQRSVPSVHSSISVHPAAPIGAVAVNPEFNNYIKANDYFA